MGTCGCIEPNVSGARFAGPDGSWYTIEYYTGCNYCMEMPGITLGHYKPADPMFDEIMELPVIEPGPLYLLLASDVEKAKKKMIERGEDFSMDEWDAEEYIQFHRSIAHEMAMEWRKHLLGDKKTSSDD